MFKKNGIRVTAAGILLAVSPLSAMGTADAAASKAGPRQFHGAHAAAITHLAYPLYRARLNVVGGTRRQGGTVTLTGARFAPGTLVTLTICGGRNLGSANTNARGQFRSTFRIPRATPTGQCTVRAAGVAPTVGSAVATDRFRVKARR